MEQFPKYYILDRRVVGSMDGAKRVVEALAGASALSAYPWVATVLILLRVALSFGVSSAVLRNPINLESTQTISQPEPLVDNSTPAPDVMPTETKPD